MTGLRTAEVDPVGEARLKEDRIAKEYLAWGSDGLHTTAEAGFHVLVGNHDHVIGCHVKAETIGLLKLTIIVSLMPVISWYRARRIASSSFVQPMASKLKGMRPCTG